MSDHALAPLSDAEADRIAEQVDWMSYPGWKGAWRRQVVRQVAALLAPHGVEAVLAELEASITKLAAVRQAEYLRGYDSAGDQAAGLRQARGLLWEMQVKRGLDVTFTPDEDGARDGDS